ncbi:MAG: TrmB family transcriptional regulator [Candidatus Freyarchaeota archaeon]|nr:TrmB family transcriptional regulator [Candidatus Freyrarchaeum guaymaensis]
MLHRGGDVRRALERVGLTGYEAEVYLTLVEGGALTAREVSRRSGVPYSRIYDVLERLEEKGWIQVHGGRPKLYAAMPPREAMRVVKLRFQRDIEENERKIVEILQPIYERTEGAEQPNIWIIHGEQNILSKFKEMIEKARREVLIALPVVVEGVIEPVEEILRRLRSGNVTVKIMASVLDEKVLERLSRMVGKENVTARDIMYGGGVIVDGREAMIVLLDQAEGGFRFSMGIWSDHIGLAMIASGYFNFLWETSKKDDAGFR